MFLVKNPLLFVAFFLALLLSPASLISKEPSVLQDGYTQQDLQNLVNEEKTRSVKIFELESRIKQLETSLEGLKSVLDGYGANLKNLNDKAAANPDTAALSAQVESNTQNIQALKTNLETIESSTNKIHELLSQELKPEGKDAESAKKSAQSAETNQPNNESPAKKANESKDSKNSTKRAEKMDGKKVDGGKVDFDRDITKRGEIFKQAKSLTYAKKFDEAKARYEWFIEIDYKKPESNYMLGNIAYENNAYNDAIFYYKESATLDDKANYMPRLLLNTANSFRVLKDLDNAKKFYNSLLSLYPNTSEAKEAKTQLGKLK